MRAASRSSGWEPNGSDADGGDERAGSRAAGECAADRVDPPGVPRGDLGGMELGSGGDGGCALLRADVLHHGVLSPVLFAPDVSGAPGDAVSVRAGG